MYYYIIINVSKNKTGSLFYTTYNILFKQNISYMIVLLLMSFHISDIWMAGNVVTVQRKNTWLTFCVARSCYLKIHKADFKILRTKLCVRVFLFCFHFHFISTWAYAQIAIGIFAHMCLAYKRTPILILRHGISNDAIVKRNELKSKRSEATSRPGCTDKQRQWDRGGKR